MVSAIDATKPVDGIPAVKSELRANLAAAKAEIEALQAGGTALPVGGTTGQVLAKQSGTNYDVDWESQSAGSAASGVSYSQLGISASSQTVQARLRYGIVTPQDFGAVGNGIADDSAAFAAMSEAFLDVAHEPLQATVLTNSEQASVGNTQGAMVSGHHIFLPPGIYRVKNWTLQRTVRVSGCGRASRLCPTDDATATDYCMKVVQPSPNVYRNFGNHHPGVILQDFMLDGVGRTIVTNGLGLEWLDRCGVSNITVEEFNGCGIDCRTTVRESTFTNLRMKYNGNATKPQLSVWDNDDTSTDGHNNLHFIGCGFEYPIGDNVHVGRTTVAAGPNRNIFFSNHLFHGVTGSGEVYPSPATPTTHLLITRGNHIHVNCCRFHAWGEGKPAIHLTFEPGQNPTTGLRCNDVIVTNCNFSSAFNDAGTPLTVDATQPHVRISAQSTLIESANSPEGTGDLVVDNPASIGTWRKWNYTDT